MHRGSQGQGVNELTRDVTKKGAVKNMFSSAICLSTASSQIPGRIPGRISRQTKVNEVDTQPHLPAAQLTNGQRSTRVGVGADAAHGV